MKRTKLNIEKKYTPRQLAEAFVFRSELSPTEIQEADDLLRLMRTRSLQQMSEGEKVSLNLLGLKYEMEDYARFEGYDSEKTFGLFVKRYAKEIQRKNYELADDLGMDSTRFSQIINGKIIPSEKIVFRLEYHSNNIIPGSLWLEVLQKEIAYRAEQDVETRKSEYKIVKKRMDLGKKIGFIANKTSDVQKRVKEFSSALVASDVSVSYKAKKRTR